MTLVVGESQHFSQQLLKHAASLNLTTRSTVGEWSYGQGIRRAKDNSYFYELRSTHYSPFGVNHPVMLKVKESSETNVSQKFDPSLVKRFGFLADWYWSILPTRPQLTSADHFQEDATLKAEHGLSGFTAAAGKKSWSIDLGQNLSWVASSQELPITEQNESTRAAFAAMKLLLTNDVLGEQGRLIEWQQHLHSTYSWGEWQGLNFHWQPTFAVNDAAKELNAQGIAVDIVGNKLRACFGLSMFRDDVAEIMKAFRLQQGK